MKIRRVDFSPDEWLAGTVELSNEDRGVYITICALIYSRGGPIRYELLKGHSHSHGNKLQASLDRLEGGGKIVRNGSEIDQKRCENELEKARKRHEKALENGSKGGRPKDLDKPDGSEGGKTNHQPSTINHQPTEKESPLESPPVPLRPSKAARPNGLAESDLAEEFSAIWPLFPRRVGKGQAKRAYAAARRKADRSTIENGVRAFAEQSSGRDARYVKHPASWLNGECWTDELPVRCRDPTRPESIGGYVPPEF